MAAVTLSAGIFGLTKVANFSNTAYGENEFGTFVLDGENNNGWTGTWEEFDVVSDRSTTATAELCSWGDVAFSQKAGALCHIDVGETEDNEARIVLFASGITGFTMELNKDVNYHCEAGVKDGGFVYSDNYTKKTVNCTFDDTYTNINRVYISFIAEDNYGEFDVDVLSVTYTYSVSNCLSF